MITTVLWENRCGPGFAGKSIPGVVADVVDKDGKSVEPGKERFPCDPRAVALHDADGV